MLCKGRAGRLQPLDGITAQQACTQPLASMAYMRWASKAPHTCPTCHSLSQGAGLGDYDISLNIHKCPLSLLSSHSSVFISWLLHSSIIELATFANIPTGLFQSSCRNCNLIAKEMGKTFEIKGSGLICTRRNLTWRFLCYVLWTKKKKSDRFTYFNIYNVSLTALFIKKCINSTILLEARGSFTG